LKHFKAILLQTRKLATELTSAIKIKLEWMFVKKWSDEEIKRFKGKIERENKHFKNNARLK